MFPLYDDNPTQRTPIVTYALILINVLALVWLAIFRRPRSKRLFMNTDSSRRGSAN